MNCPPIHPYPMDSLETVRIRLEQLRGDHADVMFEGLSNPGLYEFIAENPPASVEALRDRYKRLESRRSPRGDEDWLNWALLSKPTLRAQGYVQSTVAGRTARIAYVLFEEAWRQGLGREAVRAMLAHLREHYSVTRAMATVDTRNLRSIRLLENLGFSRSQVRIEAEWVHGVLADEADYILKL